MNNKKKLTMALAVLFAVNVFIIFWGEKKEKLFICLAFFVNK